MQTFVRIICDLLNLESFLKFLHSRVSIKL